MPYLIATAVGLLPGTIAVVVLGDALTGRTNPALVVITAISVVIGLAGLLVDARLGSEEPDVDGPVESRSPFDLCTWCRTTLRASANDGLGRSRRCDASGFPLDCEG